jgi:hypothetical protein
MPAPQKPGEKPARPGEYEERNRQGGPVPKPRQITIEPGDQRLPPTRKSNRRWVWIGPPEK